MKTLTLIELETFLSKNSDLTYETLEENRQENCKISDLHYSGCKINEGTYTQVIFENCDFFACHFAKTEFKDCLFINCKFHFSHMMNCIFQGCSFENSDLTCSTFKNCVVKATELDAALNEVLSIPEFEEDFRLAA